MATDTLRNAGKSPWFEALGRVGLVATAAVYGLVAVIALLVAVGHGSRTRDTQGALEVVRDEPLGVVALWLIAIGLIAAGAWRLAQALLDRDDEGEGLAGLWVRGLKFGRALVYLGLAYATIRIAASSGGGSSGQDEQGRTADVLGWPGGVLLVLAVAAGLLAAAGWSAYLAVSGKFLNELRKDELRESARHSARIIGTVGYLARAVVFAIAGVFLAKAALEYDPDEAKGLDGALATLADQRYGSLLLGLVAAGLGAYAAYCLIAARYARV